MADSDIKYSELTLKEYHIHFPEEIDELDDFKDILDLLVTASSEETINIYIGGYGGSINIGLRLISAIYQCRGNVQIYVIAPVYSMHTLIALSAPNRPYIDNPDLIYFMFHDISSGYEGKISEINSGVSNQIQNTKNIFNTLVGHILNKKEINDILKGQDLYLNGNEIIDRLNKINPVIPEE